METWKSVVGWEDEYDVSDLGRLRRSYKASRARSTFPGRILKAGLGVYGYPLVRFYRERKGKTFIVHRLVAAAFLGPCPAGKEVNHKDGNRANAAVSNLEYVTRSENNLHAYRVLGRKAAPKYGSASSRSKLKEKQVIEIVRRAKGGETKTALAACFGVDRTTVSMIVLGKNWSHLTGIAR